MFLSDSQKIGAGLVSFGLFFFFLGVILVFDVGLLAMGNILFLAGITMIIGPNRTLTFFTLPKRVRGTVCFFIGFIMVFFKFRTGFIVELVGAINLFGDFFPTILSFLRSMPFIGTVLNLPGVARVLDRLVGGTSPA